MTSEPNNEGFFYGYDGNPFESIPYPDGSWQAEDWFAGYLEGCAWRKSDQQADRLFLSDQLY